MADYRAVSDESAGEDSAAIPGSADTPDVGAAHPTGEEQAAINRENDPPA